MPRTILFAFVGAIAALQVGGPDDALPLRPIPGPEEPPPETPWLAYLAMACTAIPGIVGTVILCRWLFRPRLPPALTPREWALQELEHTEPALGFEARHIERLAGVLRAYLHRQFQLPAPEQTSEEFVRVLEDLQLFNKDQRLLLGKLLAHADTVKFAQGTTSPDEFKAYRNEVLQFVQETSQDCPSPPLSELSQSPPP